MCWRACLSGPSLPLPTESRCFFCMFASRSRIVCCMLAEKISSLLLSGRSVVLQLRELTGA